MQLEECVKIIIKLIMHSFLSSHLRWDMWQWKLLSVLKKFENGRLPKYCAAFLRQNGIQEDNRFTDSEATKNCCEEMKESLNLPGCSCT